MKKLIKKLIKESDFDWVKDFKPMTLGGSYVFDVSDLTKLKFNNLIGDLRSLGYRGYYGSYGRTVYLYIELISDGTLAFDWSENRVEDPTYGGDYEIVTTEDFYKMYYRLRDERLEGLMNESDFGWVSDINETSVYIGQEYIDGGGNTYKVKGFEDRSNDKTYGEYWRVKMVLIEHHVKSSDSRFTRLEKLDLVKKLIEDGTLKPINQDTKLTESNGFDWVGSVRANQHLDNYNENSWMDLASQVYTGKEVMSYDDDTYETEIRVLPNMELTSKKQDFYDILIQKTFSDTYPGGKGVLLKIYDFDDLSTLFEDRPTEYGRIGRDVAKNVIGGDDLDWEPYWDTYSDWEDDVWDITTDENKNYIYSIIKDRYIGEEMDDGGEFTEEVLGRLIEEDTVGSFIDIEDFLSDIKSDLGSCHNRAYNDVARKQVSDSVHGAIEYVLGSFEWGKVNRSVYRDGRYQDTEETSMDFDITDIFRDVIDLYMTNYCDYDDIESYDSGCDLEYSSFTEILGLVMYETDYNEGLLNPSYDEYPDHTDVEKYYNDGIGDYM